MINLTTHKIHLVETRDKYYLFKPKWCDKSKSYCWAQHKNPNIPYASTALCKYSLADEQGPLFCTNPEYANRALPKERPNSFYQPISDQLNLDIAKELYVP